MCSHRAHHINEMHLAAVTWTIMNSLNIQINSIDTQNTVIFVCILFVQNPFFSLLVLFAPHNLFRIYEIQLFSYLSKLSLSALFQLIDICCGFIYFFFLFRCLHPNICSSHRLVLLFFLGLCYRCNSPCLTYAGLIFHWKSRIIQCCNAYGLLIVKEKKQQRNRLCAVDNCAVAYANTSIYLFTNE